MLLAAVTQAQRDAVSLEQWLGRERPATQVTSEYRWRNEGQETKKNVSDTDMADHSLNGHRSQIPNSQLSQEKTFILIKLGLKFLAIIAGM